jgi:hypothetical protein
VTHNIDFDRFNWDGVFRAVDKAQSLNDNAMKMSKGLMVELALAEHSDGQLLWVGGSAKGYDLTTPDGDPVRFEVKHLARGWAGKTAKEIIIGNHRGSNLGVRNEKEFDYLIFVGGDDQKRSVNYNHWVVGVTTFEQVQPYLTTTDSTIKIEKMPKYEFDLVARGEMQVTEFDISDLMVQVLKEAVK